MKQIILILVFLLSKSAICQTTFLVDHFSKNYYGKIFIADTTEVFSKGWVTIYDRKTKKELIKVESAELTFTLHNGNAIANIKELPYGEQSQIMYEDYNFDGIKDFAIMDGQNSCYHGPSFKIYLATKNGFKQSPEFTELSQNYCGMFDINYKTKTISTMVKSGCCWHQFSEFKVKNNKPYPIKIVERGIGATGITSDYIESVLINGKMVETSSQYLEFEADKNNLVLSFEFENKKKMQIFFIADINTLFYVFTKPNNKIELIYFDNFKYSKTENSFIFSNNNTQYMIYDEKIIVKTPKKTYEMRPVANTKLGTLKKLKDLKFDNLSM